MRRWTCTKDGGVQVASHDDEEVGPVWNFGLEKTGVCKCLLGAVDGARADDDEDTVILASDDAGRLVAGEGDCLARTLGAYYLVFDERGLDKRVILVMIEVGVNKGNREDRGTTGRRVAGSRVDIGGAGNGMIRGDIEDEGGTYTEDTLVVEVFVNTLFVKGVWRTGLHRVKNWYCRVEGLL